MGKSNRKKKHSIHNKQQKVNPKTRKKAKKKIGYLVVLVIVLLIAGIIALQNMAPKAEYTELTTDRPSYGNLESTVTLIEFSDLECPACSGFHSSLLQLKEEYGDRIEIQYRHFPLTSIHRFAFTAAAASECMQDQGLFWEYIDVVFANQQALTKTNLINYGTEVGGDPDLLKACIDSGKKEKYVKQDQQMGRQMGVGGTPSIYVNGKPVLQNSYAAVKSSIDAALVASTPVVVAQ